VWSGIPLKVLWVQVFFAPHNDNHEISRVSRVNNNLPYTDRTVRKEISMQLRCSYCQTMFAISREETLAALEHMADNNLKYYDAHCPNCRRANRVERIKLEASYPGWQEEIKKMAREAKKAEEAASSSESAKPEASAKTRESTSKQAGTKTAAKPAPAKKGPAKTTIAAKGKRS